MSELQSSLVSIARSYLGKTEIPSNLGFHDPEFEKQIRTTGWTPPEPWCAALLKLVFSQAFSQLQPDYIDKIHQYFTLSAVQTYDNLKACKEFHVTQTPEAGYAVIFKEGNGPFGHAGLVTEVNGDSFKFISGNTTDPAHPMSGMNNPREGYTVAEKTHSLSAPFNPHGLNLDGFISPDPIA